MGNEEREKVQSEAQAEAVEGSESIVDKILSTVATEPTTGTLEQDSIAGKTARALDFLIDTLIEKEAKIDKVDKNLVEMVIKDIDQRLSAQVNEIMHNKDFQKLEASWRGLWFAVDRTDFRKNIKVEILNCSKDALNEDFDDAPETVQSGLYKHMYSLEYDQAGADPFSMIVGNFAFSHQSNDLKLLQEMSKVAAATHCPFISSVGSEFFGGKDLNALTKVPDISALMDQTEYTKWRNLRDKEDSRYLGLTMNRFLLRLPYGPGNEEVKTFDFKEDVVDDVENYLWGNPVFAFMSNVNRCFADHGWAVHIRGPQAGGKVDNLPLHIYESDVGIESRIPTEVLLSGTQEFELANNGFIPLVPYKNKDFAVFFSAQSIQKPQVYDNPDATANSKLSANLPYLFLVSRISHYLKVLQREVIGSSKEKDEVQKELRDWIKQYVTEQNNPSEEQKAKYPLRQASVDVTESPDAPGFFNISLKVRPHFQVEGVNVDLSLVSRVPKK